MAAGGNIQHRVKCQEIIEVQGEFSKMLSRKLWFRRIRSCFAKDHALHSLLRVRNPSQNPKTTPRTIASCSIDKSDPRSSGGLISAM